MFLSTGNVVPSENKWGAEKALSEVEQLVLIQVVFDKAGIYLEFKFKDIAEEYLPLHTAYKTYI